MLTRRLIQWSGLIAILGGILFPLAAILHPNGEDIASVLMPIWVPAHFLGWMSVTLIHIGLIGLYARQAENAGWLGLIGFLLAFIGGAFAGTIQYVNFTVIPLIAKQAPAIFFQATILSPFAMLLFILGFVLGYILFGAATVDADVLPRWAGFLVIIGIIFFFLGELSFIGQRISPDPAIHQFFGIIRSLRPIVILGDAAFGLGLVWMGYSVWSEKSEPIR
jgi:hypothetical protein